jgi:hypothetical protein
MKQIYPVPRVRIVGKAKVLLAMREKKVRQKHDAAAEPHPNAIPFYLFRACSEGHHLTWTGRSSWI